MRSVFGMLARRRWPFVVGVVLALFAGSTALAATRYSPWRLGAIESVGAWTTGLTGTYGADLLRIINGSTGSSARAIRAESKSASAGTIYAKNSGGGPAANFAVNSGKAPFTVSSTSARVRFLDADKLDGADSSAFLRATGKAADADTLDGIDSSAFLRTTGKAADADKLDGIDSSGFVRGTGEKGAFAFEIEPDVGLVIPAGSADSTRLFSLEYRCPATLTSNGSLTFYNNSGEAANLFSDNGGTNPTYVALTATGPGLSFTQETNAGGERIELQLGNASQKFATLRVYTVHRSGACHIQIQWSTTV